MPFLKITYPAKRDLIVKEYLQTKKNIRDNLLAERTGEQVMQTELSKFFKPITETQKATAKEITEGLKPIKEGIEQLPQQLPQQVPQQLPQQLPKPQLGPEDFDKTFGIYEEGGNFILAINDLLMTQMTIVLLLVTKDMKQRVDYGNLLHPTTLIPTLLKIIQIMLKS